MLQLLKSLRSRTRGKDMTDADILSWANRKVRTMGRKSQIESFKVHLSLYQLQNSTLSTIVTFLVNQNQNQNKNQNQKSSGQESIERAILPRPSMGG